MSDTTKNIRVDDELDGYEGFFDHEWAKSLRIAVRQTKLSSACFDLLTTWKGISEARRLPWLMIQAVKAGVEGSLNFATPMPSQVLNELLSRIGDGLETHHISLSGNDRAALRSEIRAIESQISARIRHPIRLDPKELWSDFFQSQGIALSLYMSEVNAYAGVYFAYENYLIRSMKEVTGLKSLRTDKLPSTLECLVGKTIVEKCWKEKPIELPRLIRHAIAHNGRKVTSHLEKYRSEISLEADEVVIMAHHTTELYQLLKETAYLFTTKIVKLPASKNGG